MMTDGYYVRETTLDKVPVPNILYKYRKAEDEFHRENLRTGTVYFSSPEGFKDKDDCNNPIRFDLQTEEEIFIKYYDEFKRRFPLRGKDYIISRTKAKIAEGSYKDFDNLQRLQREKTNNTIGVLSLTAEPKNPLMWDEYANKLNGFCLGFDSELLKPVIGGAGPIKYDDSLPLIKHDDPIEIIADKLAMYKRNEFVYEKEYRVYRMRYNAVKCDDRNVPFNKNSLVKVIIGENVKPEIREQIIKEAQAINPDIEILTATLIKGVIEIV